MIQSQGKKESMETERKMDQMDLVDKYFKVANTSIFLKENIINEWKENVVLKNEPTENFQQVLKIQKRTEWKF